MKRVGPEMLLTLITSLTTAAGLVISLDVGSWGRREERAREFQQLVGGLGLGPATDASVCAFDFDPRLSPCCSQAHGRLPEGRFYCPRHGCSIFWYPALGEAGR